MKLVLSSDHHHGLESFGTENVITHLSTRTEDGFQALDQVVNYILNNNIEYYLISGDVFNTKTISQTVVDAFFKRLKILSDSNVKTLILLGNHDKSRIVGTKCGLELINTLEIPNVIVTPGNSFHDFGDLQVATVSYWNSAEEVVDVVNSLAAQVDWTRPAVLLVHLQIDYPDFPGAFKANLPFVPLEALITHDWLFVQAGHIHRAQVLNQKPFAFYVGSLVRCSAAEENETKGFWVSEIEDNKLKSIKQIEVDCLKFITFKGTMSELKEIKLPSNSDFSNHIVKLKIIQDEDPIDNAYIKETFGTAFKYIIEKINKEKPTTKMSGITNIGMDNYLEIYFKDDPDKDDIIKLIDSLQQIDQKVER